MTFTQALNVICDSGKVTRKEWDDESSYCLMRGDHLTIHLNGRFHDWVISWGDLLAEDWVQL